ncbi:MBL fold metallo-hydrolase [Desertibacillus haloalkaliphilus]|uniref:MBL fold metallo-hydrolase n=1 Tax=Desertibacillus haloalkaliphilus TaxID=1328930 RepID=UPI001C260B1F|nr:MBL fold metallo-hydrolase [Desertibacillus haloalkaliphilus]MBU8907887.1 MBL fold metallo-hydrolase [Desertibacillus haloalkaliphilus]
MNRIGPLIIIEGRNNSKVPYSRNVYINGSEKVLIDCGADEKSLTKLNQELGIEFIINTHYHPDHTQYNYLFPNAQKWINPLEYHMSQSVDAIARANGIYQEAGESGVEKWKEAIPQQWVNSLRGLSQTYEYEVEYEFDGVKVLMLHTPGHTSGLASPYFPELGVVYVSDYDMSSFGPWYNGTDGSIDDFIRSGKRLLDLDANTYITGHQKGIFTKQEFQEEMERFLGIIDQRDEGISKYVQRGLTFEELTSIGIFYPEHTLDVPIFKTWERSGIRKHLHRLGLNQLENDNSQIVTKSSSLS